MGRSCCIFCNNCLTLLFSRGKYVTPVPRDNGFVAIEQLRLLGLRAPDRILRDAQVDPDRTDGRLINAEFAPPSAGVTPLMRPLPVRIAPVRGAAFRKGSCT